MTSNEFLLLDTINEMYGIEESDYIITEFKVPQVVDALDLAKYKNLFKQANDIIQNNNGEKVIDTGSIVNLILDLLKVILNVLVNGEFNANISNKIFPTGKPDSNFFKDMNFHIKIYKLNGTKRIIMINPIKHIVNYFVSQLLNLLIETVVAPVRVKGMIISYKKIIESLEKIKRTCRDEDIEKSCQKQIDKINKAIKELESKIKEDSEMKSLREFMEELNENTVDDDYVSTNRSTSVCAEDKLISMVESTIEELEEACKNKKGCKTEGTNKEVEDDDDDLEPENESFEFDDCGFNFSL